ncbi:hypothetical protein DAPPUDRAFT_259418 [Daphnia pulex]|uniref:Uncharacterized protein n=1 Tax=Daphnia pulex TaxID=6669 RepID=E9HH78_DAPPU|nr:hypothetical protein DAPPUDRAFT_259418 [Daphnia pulex]|eukprot:EFX68893.1 hypothetical protein DAPPUDRAFT_259418 [Daphnia pulex]
MSTNVQILSWMIAEEDIRDQLNYLFAKGKFKDIVIQFQPLYFGMFRSLINAVVYSMIFFVNARNGYYRTQGREE